MIWSHSRRIYRVLIGSCPQSHLERIRESSKRIRWRFLSWMCTAYMLKLAGVSSNPRYWTICGWSSSFKVSLSSFKARTTDVCLVSFLSLTVWGSLTCLTAIISPVLAFIARNTRPCVPLPISSPQSHLNAAWSSVLWPVKLCIKLTVSARCCRYFVNFATPSKRDASRTGSYDRLVQIVRREEVFQVAVNVFWRRTRRPSQVAHFSERAGV